VRTLPSELNLVSSESLAFPCNVATSLMQAAASGEVAPDGEAGTTKICITGSEDESLRVWSIDSAGAPTCLELCEGHVGPVTSLATQPTGRMFASGSHDRSINLWSSAAVSDALFLAICPNQTEPQPCFCVFFGPRPRIAPKLSLWVWFLGGLFLNLCPWKYSCSSHEPRACGAGFVVDPLHALTDGMWWREANLTFVVGRLESNLATGCGRRGR
jgi:hypothetical protein